MPRIGAGWGAKCLRHTVEGVHVPERKYTDEANETESDKVCDEPDCFRLLIDPCCKECGIGQYCLFHRQHRAASELHRPGGHRAQ